MLPTNLIDAGAVNISKIALFVFIIGGNFVSDVFSCSLRKYVKDNMVIKHVMAFFILLIFVGLADETINMKEKMGLSVFLYFWFLFIMRSTLVITIISIISIVVLYIIQGFINDMDPTSKSTYNLKQIRNYIFMSSVLLSFVGFLYFVLEAKSKYKDFSIPKFVIGLNNDDCLKD